MKVLIVGRYVQPGINSNQHSITYGQALSLKLDHGVDVEILTWPFNDAWTLPIPDKRAGVLIPPMRFETGHLVYHVINPPDEWNERPLLSDTWDAAVAFGMRLLAVIHPDIVHLQSWFGLWWILESAQRLGIPTVYTNFDWGMACLRTVLVMGDNSLCDGQLSIQKCAQCILQGRGFIGKANEFIVTTAVGRMLMAAAYRSPWKSLLERYQALRIPVRMRVDLNLHRAKKVLSRLDAMFTPSKFGRGFFSQLGVPLDRIQVKPWYHDPAMLPKTIHSDQKFTITYIGRVSPEKGVHLVFEALARAQLKTVVQLRIVGANTSTYCTKLKQKYATMVGMHMVEWLGWSEVGPLFLSTDVTIIPSACMDNTPLVLVESMSYKVPVIATKIPPIEELVIEGQNGYLAGYMSVDSFAAAIERAVADKDRIRNGHLSFPRVETNREYTLAVKNTYLMIASRR